MERNITADILTMGILLILVSSCFMVFIKSYEYKKTQFFTGIYLSITIVSITMLVNFIIDLLNNN